MPSPEQLTANRANAQLSTGPVTDAGKQTVSRNALSHGLAGRTHAALAGEEEPFAQYCRGMLEALGPVGAIEEDFAQLIAADRWRLHRAHKMENALFAQIEREQSGELDAATADVQAWVDPAKGLQRIALYAARIQRAIEKNTADLKTLQAARLAAYAQAQEEAILLTQHAAAKGQTYNPALDFPATEDCGGFVYSAPAIAHRIDRARRLEEAKVRFAPESAALLANALSML